MYLITKAQFIDNICDFIFILIQLSCNDNVLIVNNHMKRNE